MAKNETDIATNVEMAGACQVRGMDDRRIASIYEEYVVAHDLERSPLLEGLRARCSGTPTVLYPGSFIHITPSFYFQHVVYVDRSDFAWDFFSKSQAVLDAVSARRTYPQRPFIRFLQHDFTHDLPVPQDSFDVLLALYVGGVSRSCARYVKPGGWLLSNDHHGDAGDAATDSQLELKAVVLQDRGKVCFQESDLEQFALSAAPNRTRSRKGSRADYFLFRKRRSADARQR